MRKIHLVDSITELTAEMSGAVVVSGSHGGWSAAGYALALEPRVHAVFFNDAGIGKDRAGIVALDLLEQVGVIAATYCHLSARIGEAADGLANGVISAVNRSAVTAGLEPGQPVAEAVALLGSRPELG